jgi:toxin ParE1/3/4
VKVSILPEALAELQQAKWFYTEQANSDLGEVFLGEFERSIAALIEHPLVGIVWRAGTRRLPLRRFPYSVVYQVKPDLLRIVAVAHQSRRPGYWAGRK